jgi:hypothetical protein
MTVNQQSESSKDHQQQKWLSSELSKTPADYAVGRGSNMTLIGGRRGTRTPDICHVKAAL